MVGIKQYDGLHRSDCQACSRPLQEDMRGRNLIWRMPRATIKSVHLISD